MLTILFLATAFWGNAQSNIELNLIYTVKGDPLKPEKAYVNPAGEEYHISNFKYYLSMPGTSPRLMNAFMPDTLLYTLSPGKYKLLPMVLGVDSALIMKADYNNDLDPVNGMFWTWVTGYINFKLDGHSTSSKLATQKYEYHIGGYSGETKTQQHFALKLPPGTKFKKHKKYRIDISVDLHDFWLQNPWLRIAEQPAIAQPGEKAVQVANTLPAIFKVKKVQRL